MQFVDILAKDFVVTSLKATSKKQALEELAQKARRSSRTRRQPPQDGLGSNRPDGEGCSAREQ